MKKTIITLLLTATAFSLFAQGNNVYRPTSARDMYAKAQSYIGLWGGYSILVGSPLTKTDYKDLSSGFAAGGGASGGLRGVFFFSPNFGVGGSASYLNYNTQGAQQLAEGFRADYTATKCTVTQKGGYTLLNGAIGPVFTMPIGSISLDLHGFVGGTQTTAPEVVVDIDDNSPQSFTYESGSAWALGWQAGLGIRFHCSENISIGLHADYSATAPKILRSYTSQSPFALGRPMTEYNANISAAQGSLGVYYDFSND